MVRPWLGRFCFVFGSFLLFLSSLKCVASHAAGVFDVAFAEWRRLISQTWTCFVERFLQRFLQGCLFFFVFWWIFFIQRISIVRFRGTADGCGWNLFSTVSIKFSIRFHNALDRLEKKTPPFVDSARRLFPLADALLFVPRFLFVSEEKTKPKRKKKKKSALFLYGPDTRKERNKWQSTNAVHEFFANAVERRSSVVGCASVFLGGGIFLYLPDITWNAIDLMRVESNNVFGCTTCSRSIQSSFISNSCSSFDFTLLPDAKVRWTRKTWCRQKKKKKKDAKSKRKKKKKKKASHRTCRSCQHWPSKPPAERTCAPPDSWNWKEMIVSGDQSDQIQHAIMIGLFTRYDRVLVIENCNWWGQTSVEWILIVLVS